MPNRIGSNADDALQRGSPVTGRAPSLCFLVAAAQFAAVVPAPAAPAFPELTASVIDDYVVPRFARLKQATDKLAKDLDAACPGQPRRLTAVRADFDRAALAWAAVAFLRFGPMSVTGRPERFAYWPDPRGVMHRQLRALIARRDPSALNPQELANKSVAVQGLTALEALLVNPKHPLGSEDEESRYRCRLAASVAHNLDNIARDILSDWSGAQGWRRRMLEPGPQNASYRTPAEPPAEFARALISGLQMVQDQQIAPLIAAQTTPSKAPRLPFARSGLSARYVAAAIASLEALYKAMGLGNDVPKKKAWMPRWIAIAFRRLAEDAPAAVQKKASSETDKERERELRILRFHVDGIRKLIGRELAPLAGLTIGFNELDGD